MASRAGLCFAAVLVLLALGCQPVEPTDLGDDDAPIGGEAATDPVGSPDQALPATLDELFTALHSTAAQWQNAPVVSEVLVNLDGDGAWREASVTYLAPDADRFLVVQLSAEGTSQEQPTLEGLELSAVPEPALAEVPDPDGLLDPSALIDAAEPTLDECGVGAPPGTVLYASGAPAAWDGERWTEPPQWTATVSFEATAAVDARSGEPTRADPCIAD